MGSPEYTSSIALNMEGNAEKAIGNVANSVQNLIGQLGQIAGVSIGLGAIAAAIGSVVKQSVGFQAEMESSRLAIAGMVTTFMTVNGAAVSHDRAMEEATKAQQGLRIAALETAFEYTELVTTFQTIFPAAVQAGFKTDQVVAFSETIAQLAAGTKMPLQEVSTQISLIMAGVVRAEGRVGLMFKNAGVTTETLQLWKAQGTTFENMTRIMKGFADMAPYVNQTWSAAWSNLKDAFHQALGASGGGMFDEAKKAVLGLTDSIVKISKGEFTFNPALMASLARFDDGMSAIIRKLAEMGPSILAFGAAGLGAFGDLFKAAAPILVVVTVLLKLISPLIDIFGAWAAGIWLVVKAAAGLEAAMLAVKTAYLAQAAAQAAASAAQAASGGIAAAGTAAGMTWAGSFAAAIKGTLPGLVGAAIAGLALLPLWDFKQQQEGEANQAWSDYSENLKTYIERVKDVHGVTLTAAEAEDVWKVALKDREAIFVKMSAEHLSYAKAAEAVRGELQAMEKAADPAEINKLNNELQELRDTTASMGLSGLSKELKDISGKYAEEGQKFAQEWALATNAETKSLLSQKIEEISRQEFAALAAARQKAGDENAKRRLELQAQQGEIANLYLDGGQKEVASIIAGTVAKVASLEQERAILQRSNAADAEQIRLKTKAITQEQQKGAAEIVAWASKTWQEYRATSVEEAASAISDSGDTVAAELLKIREKYRLMAEKMGQDIAAINAAIASAAGQGADTGYLEKARAELENVSKGIGTYQAAAEKRASMTVFEQMAHDVDTLKSSFDRGKISLDELQRGLLAIAEKKNILLGDSLTAGLDAFIAKIKTAAEATRDFVVSSAEALQTGLSDSIFAVISGQADSLKLTFQNLWKSILQSYSKFLAEMALGWAKSKLLGYLKSDGIASGTGISSPFLANDGTTDNGGTLPGAGAKAGGSGLSGIAAGLGIGALVAGASAPNTWLGNQLSQIGMTIGAMIGGWVGVAIAAVGLIASALAPRPADKSESFNAAAYLPGGSGWGNSERDSQGRAVISSWSGQMADLFRMDDAGGAKKLYAEFQKSLFAIVGSMTGTIAAGSQGDFDSDWKQFFGKMLPRMALSAAFGQTGMGGPSPGMGASFDSMLNPYFSGLGDSAHSQLFDPGAPIPKFLAGLGMTADSIGILASRIQSDDPQKLMDYITGLATVLIGFRDNIVNLGKSASEIMAGQDAAKNAAPAEAFKTSADNLIQLASELSMYTGDEQITKAKELNDAVAQRYQDELAEIQKIRDLMAAADKSITTLIERIDNSQKGADWLLQDQRNAATGAAWNLGQATTPDQVQKWGDAAIQAAGAVLDVLLARLTQAKSILQGITDLQTAFSTVGTTVQRALDLQNRALDTFLADTTKLGKDLAAASKLSGQAQIDALAKVGTSAKDLYDRLSSMLQAIAENTTALHDSIAKQIWQIGYDAANPQAQAGMIQSQVSDLYAQLAKAQSPEEVQRITNEIQSLMSTYLNLFPKDDPRRKAAEQFVIDFLKRTEKAADSAYSDMEKKLTKARDTIIATLTATATALGTVIDGLSTEIATWKTWLGDLRDQIDAKLTGMIDSIVATNEQLRIELEKTKILFTNLNESDVSSAVQSLSENSAAAAENLTAVATSASRFGTALDAVSARLEAMGGAQGSGQREPASVNVNVQAGGNTDALAARIYEAVRSSFRRNPQLFARAV